MSRRFIASTRMAGTPADWADLPRIGPAPAPLLPPSLWLAMTTLAIGFTGGVAAVIAIGLAI